MYNKYFSFEINTETREMLNRAERLKNWLIDNDYKIETSGCFNCVHFEIYIESHERFLKANKAIDDIVYLFKKLKKSNDNHHFVIQKF